MSLLRPQSLRAAVELLTRLPVPAARDWRPQDAIDGAAAYPLVGALVGVILAGVALLLGLTALSPLLQALLVVGAGLLLTGALHEDGLADAADGLFGAWTPQRRLEILRDSRIGTYGGLALGWALAVRVAALLALDPASWPLALVVAHTLSRWVGLAALASQPYARGDRSSVAAQVVAGVGGRHLAVGTALAAPLVLLSPLGVGAALAAALPLAGAWVALCRAKVGGVTGDLVGALILLVELATLVVWGVGPG